MARSRPAHSFATPTGRSIHGEGIPPDVEVKFERPRETEKEQSKAPNAEELFDELETGTSPSGDPTAQKKRDNQIARAVDLLKGIKVYQQSHSRSAAVN